MSRLSNEQVASRRAFIRDLFTKNPGATIDQAGAAIKAATGMAMAPGTVEQLRIEVVGDKPIVKPVTGPAPVRVDVQAQDQAQIQTTKDPKVPVLEAMIRNLQAQIVGLKEEVQILKNSKVVKGSRLTIIEVPAGTSNQSAFEVGKTLTTP